MPSSSSVASTHFLHWPSTGCFEAEKSFDIIIGVFHSLVMVVGLWYVNIYLCPPSFVTLTISFAHSVDPLKHSTGGVLRWKSCEQQFTGPVFISINQSNCSSDQWISVFGGCFITTFIMCMGWLIYFLHYLLDVIIVCVTVGPQC